MPPDFKRIRKVTPRPAPRGAGVSVFAPQTPEQALGVEPKTTHAPNQAPYKPGRSPVQVTTTRVNRQRAASPVPRNPADPRVVQIQTHLRALGYNVSVDGVMGPETRAGMAASNRGTTPNHVHHPEHARTYATLHEAKVEARHVIKNRNSFKPFYPGQKPDHFIEGPAATSGQFGVGVPIRRPVYVLPAAGPTGDETGLNAEQAAQAKRLEIENEGGLFPYVVKTGLESLVPARSAHALVNGHAPSRGDIASDVFNGALWLTPGTVAPALRTVRVVTDALREEGITANALRTIREARGAIRTASEDTQALRRAMSVAKTEQRLQGPIASPVKDQIAAAAEAAPNITKKQAQAYLTVNDLAARSVANILKTTPEHAYELIWKGAKFHDVAPTADELRAGTLAQTGREPEITNLSQVPEFHQIDSQPIQRAARNLLRTWRDAAPEHARKPKQLQGLLEDLQRRAIEAANYRHWYANSAAGILAHVNGDKSAADQLAALIAVYSPRSEVYSTSTDWNNLDRAINAFDEYHATGSISPRWSISSHLEGEGDWQTFRAQQIMEGNFEWKGLKTNRFYRNFLQHIDPEKYAQLFGSERFGTMDTWMRRAFKYPVRQKTETRETLFGREEIPTGKKDEPISPKMYAFMERATKAVADSLGWTPEEAQAAIWTSIKAETEGTPLSQAGTDFRDAFLHREARRVRPLDPEQLELSPETADKPAVAAVDAAIEATRAPDGGFTLTAGLNPDNLDTGYVVAHGAWEHREAAPLTRESLLAFRNRHLDLLRSDPSMRVGGWHNPEDGKVYLDISSNFDSLDEALQFGREQGQIAIFDRGNMDVIPTGLDPEEADAIKDGLKEQGRLTERASAYDSLLQRVHETLLGQPVKSLSMAARKDAEDALFDWAQRHEGEPETQMFHDLYHDASLARNAPDPDLLFQDDALVQSIADARGKSVDRQAILDAHAGRDLGGLPKGRRSNSDAQKIAETYMREQGMSYAPPTKYATVDEERARRIAEWYDKAVSAPDDPEVALAYEKMADETLAQYRAITREGYTFEFYPDGVDPYPSGPSAAIDDLRANRHLYVFPTDAGFGTLNEATAHPLLADSGVRWGDKPTTHNDIFRAVHDFMGHFKEGVGFRADGEENAWRAHSAMYSPEARRAMTAETRGQNSWVNYGPRGEANKTAKQSETVYADQKAVLAPEWVVHEGSDAPVVKGAVERTPGEGHFLHLFRGADVSTALHELGHAVEGLLPEGDRALLTEHGLDDPETFARSLERYFAEGVVPERRLRKTFRTLAEGMAEVYGHAEAIPGAKFNSEIAKAFDRFFLREGALDPQWAARVGASIFLQTDDQRALLEAAAMQHEQGGASVEDAAKMFGLEPDALRAHIESGEHAKDQARILSNEDVGAGAAETTQNAEDYLKKWFTQEDTFPSWWKEPQDKGLQDQVFTDARDWLGDLSFLNPEDGEPMEREQFDEMSDETIQRAVEKYYDGGWHQFLSDSNYVPDTPPAEWFAQEEGFGEASKRLLDEYGALARDVARTLPEAEWPPWVRNQLRIQAVGRDEPVSTEPYPKSSGLYPPEDWFFQEEHRPRLVAFRDMRTQFPASPSRGTRAAQRAWDTASERLESVATNLRESDNALAREAGRALTPFTTRARVPKQAAKNMLHEIRRTKALRTNEIRVLHRIGRRFALLKAGEGEQLAHYYYAQLPESHRNGEGLQLALDAQRKSRAYYEEDAAADMVADLDALQEERRALPKDAPASDVFAYLAEEGKLKQAIADIPEKIADLTTNIGKLEKVVANPPELNPDAIDAVRTLMSDRERVMFNAGLEDETADERRGLLARHLGLEPDGTEVYVGHRQGPNMPGAKFPRGASLGRSKKPGSLQRNQLALFSSGRLQQSMETIIKDWSVAQSYVFHNIAKDDLARMGEPVLGHVKPDHVLVNPKGQKIPRRLKVDPNAQAESEGFDPSDLEEYARNYMAQLPDDQKRMIEQAREFGNLHELRQVPNDVAAKYFEKLLGKKLALGTAGIRSQGGLEAVGKAVDMVNNAVYMSLIYSNPGYIPANALANLIMAGAQQGAFLPFNLLRSSQVLTHGPKRLRDLLKGEVGMGSTVALSSREGSLTQGVAHVVGGIPDNWPRIASFLHEAARAGVISKTNPVLSEKDYQALIDLLTQSGKRSLLNDVSDRAVQAMVDFNRMGPTEAAVAKRLLFVWAWIRGATRYPGRFVLDHPLRSLLGIWVASGSPGAPEEVQKKIRDVLPTFSHDMPPWLDYSIEAGHEKIQGKSFPRVFPTRSISPVSTPMELGETIVGKPGAQTFAQLLNPALQSAWYMAHRQDARGNDVKSYRESVVKNLQRDVPNASLAQDLIHPPKLQDAGLYPGDTTRLGRVERASRVFPIPVDPSVALKLRESMGLQGDLAAVHRERLENEAKAAHLPPPSKDLLLALDHKTALDHITGTNRGDAQSALKDAVRYYTKTTGRHDFDRVVPAARGNDALARQMISTIRGILIGPGLSAYEDAVKTAAEARGGKP